MIFITGPSRSGISMVARIFSLCGADGGKMDWKMEDRELQKGLSACYKKARSDIRGMSPLSYPPHDIELPREWLRQRYEQRECPFIKLPSLCWNWKSWHEVFPNAYWILVERDEVSILRACKSSGFMKAYDNPEDWSRWLHRYWMAFDQIATRPLLRSKKVHPSQFFLNDFKEIQEAVRWTGLKWDSQVPYKYRRPKREF